MLASGPGLWGRWSLDRSAAKPLLHARQAFAKIGCQPRERRLASAPWLAYARTWGASPGENCACVWSIASKHAEKKPLSWMAKQATRTVRVECPHGCFIFFFFFAVGLKWPLNAADQRPVFFWQFQVPVIRRYYVLLQSDAGYKKVLRQRPSVSQRHLCRRKTAPNVFD